MTTDTGSKGIANLIAGKPLARTGERGSMCFEPGTIKTAASILLGEPNLQLSKADELRYGTHGSLAIDVDNNTYFDHEKNAGGGLLDLIRRETGASSNASAADWLKVHGLMPATPAVVKVKARLVKSYDYRDESGQLLYQVQRFEPKKFVQRRPVGDHWEYKVKGTRRVPYRLPELLASPHHTNVYIVEGEKDADRLAELGLVATCNAGGVGKWEESFSVHLNDRVVIILPDNDDAGRDHAQKVAKSLRSATTGMVQILELPDLPEKGDVSDWLDAGGTVEELIAFKTQAPEKYDADPGDGEEGKRSQTDMLVEFARAQFELLHDRNGDVFARDSRTGEVRRLSGRQFKDRLVSAFYQKHKMAVRDQSMREAMGTLQALGRFNGAPKAINIRSAKYSDKYYLDLCEPGNSRAIELGAGYWKIVDTPPVQFVRSEAMQPLPTPLHGGNIAPLWRIANIPEQMRLLVVTWLSDSRRPDTPFPGLELIGEQGSGKSTAAEALRRVIDPSSCNLRGAPKTVEDIFVAAGQNHVVAYENVSHLAGPMQDALAILSTGGGYAKRQLFTNDDEHIINVRRPWMINGISIAVTQQDLVDRVISIECPVIEVRQSSSNQWEKFENDLPGILGGLLDTMARALGILSSLTLAPSDRPRLVEFVLLGQAVAQSAGHKQDEFLQRFNELRAETVARTLDSSPVATAILEFIEATPFGITAPVKDILARLEHHKPMGAEFWPRSPKGLGDALRRAAPALRQMGIECKSIGKLHGGTVNWCIRQKTTDSKSTKSTKSTEPENLERDPVATGTWETSVTLSPPQILDEVV